MMRRNISLATIAALFPLSFVLMRLAGVTKDVVLGSLTNFTSATSSLASVDLFLVAASLIVLGIGYGFAGFFAVVENKWDLTLAAAGATALPAIVYLGGFGAFSILLFLAVLGSLLLVQKSALRSLDIYKKVDMREVVHKATKTGFLCLTLFLAIFTFFVFIADPQYGQKVVDNVLSGVVGTDQAEFSSLEQSIKEQQKQANYQQLDMIEQALIGSMQVVPSPSMTNQERTACLAFASSTLGEIDRLSKQEIDKQLAGQSAGASQFAMVDSALSTLKNAFPFIAAFTVWAMAEFLKNVLVAPVAGLVAWLLKKIDL